MEQPRLLLIDANSLINRAFFGLYGRQNLTAPDGTPTGALFAFINMYLRFVSDIKPTHVLAAFDRKEPTFRHDLFTEYKGTRKAMPDDLAVQLPLLRQLLDAMRIARIDLAGYEADDLIGTYAHIASSKGYDVVILTGDKDSFQLISDHVTVMQPVSRGGRTENDRYDEQAVISRYGIKPAQFVDLKAIMGDPSDNIPGVKGIGEKGAMSLISEYGTLDNIYASLDQIKKALADKLAASRDLAYLSRELSQICLSAPVSEDIDHFSIREPDQQMVMSLLTRYGFKTLIDRLGLKTEVYQAEKPQTDQIESDIPLWRSSDLADYLTKIDRTPVDAGKDTQTDSVVPKSEQLVAMVLDPVFGAVAALPDERVICVEDARTALLTLTDQPVVAAFFDLKQQLGCLPLQTADYDQLYRSRYHDVMISGYLLNDMDGRPDWPRLYERLTGTIYQEPIQTTATVEPKTEPSGKAASGKRKAEASDLLQLDLLSVNQVREKLDSAESDQSDQKDCVQSVERLNGTPDLETVQKERQRLAARVVRIRQAALVQIQKSVEQKIERLTWQVEMPLTTVLAAMEHTGFAIDGNVIAELNQQFSTRLDILQEQIHAMSGRTFNLNSPKQLGDVLFQDLGLLSGKKKSSGAFSTDAEELDRLTDAHPIIPLIVEHRQLSKLRSTFLDGLSKQTDPVDQRVHTTLNQTATATGRLSSTEPNLQNIPIRMTVGQQIRRAFVAREGHILLDADYSQIELRLLAHLSGDKDMIQAFVTGQDIHVNTAINLFQLPADQITKAMRSAAKTVNFSIVYGISDFGLARDLGITVKEAHRYIHEYNEHYPGVRAYLDQLIAGAYERGYVETMLGRRRYIHELKSPNRNLRNFGERAAMNTPVQGTAADLIKLAMVQAERELRRQQLNARLILQVHDELIVEAPLDEAAAATNVLKLAMETAMTLKVPLLAEVHLADNWYNCKMQD